MLKMDNQQASGTTTPRPPSLPNTKFSIASLFHHIFSNDDVARWLLARDDKPPSSLTPDMMSRSITIESVVGGEKDVNAIILGKANSGSQVKPEKKVFVCHSNLEEFCCVSFTDERTPLAFLEPAGTCVPGVRRAVCIRTSYGYAVVSHFWLQDGRSSMTILFFKLDSKVYSEKHFILLAPYPSYRYPKVSDILEVLIGMEIHVCQFCQKRGYPACECSSSILKRNPLPGLPAVDQRDPWSLLRYTWSVWEPGFKKYQVYLKNFPRNLSTTIAAFHNTTPTFSNPETQIKGYQHYLNTVSVYFNDKMVAWGNIPDPVLRLQGMTSGAGTDNIDSKRKLMQVNMDQNNIDVELVTEEDAGDGKRRKVGLGRVVDEDVEIVQQQAVPSMMNANFYFLPPIARLKEPAVPAASLSAAKPTSSFASSLDYLLSTTGSMQIPISMPHLDVLASASIGAHETDIPNRLTDKVGSASAGSTAVPLDQVGSMQAYYSEIEVMPWTASSRVACQFCSDPGKLFGRKHDLKRHIKTIHMLERDFRCDMCNKSFKRKAHLEFHVKGVHEKSIVLPCKYCDKVYASESSLSKHVRSNHGDELMEDKCKTEECVGLG